MPGSGRKKSRIFYRFYVKGYMLYVTRFYLYYIERCQYAFKCAYFVHIVLNKEAAHSWTQMKSGATCFCFNSTVRNCAFLRCETACAVHWSVPQVLQCGHICLTFSEISPHLFHQKDEMPERSQTGNSVWKWCFSLIVYHCTKWSEFSVYKV